LENAKKSNFTVIRQEDLTPELLCEKINTTFSEPKPISNYDKETAQKIVDQILLCVD